MARASFVERCTCNQGGARQPKGILKPPGNLLGGCPPIGKALQKGGWQSVGLAVLYKRSREVIFSHPRGRFRAGSEKGYYYFRLFPRVPCFDDISCKVYYGERGLGFLRGVSIPGSANMTYDCLFCSTILMMLQECLISLLKENCQFTAIFS